MSEPSLETVKFTELLENPSKREKHFSDAVTVYIEKWTPGFLFRELPLYRSLYRGDITFTGDNDADLREAVRYQQERRVQHFPDHQIALYDAQSDSVFGLINSAPLADFFVNNPTRDIGTYLAFTGQFIFDFPPHIHGRNRICSSVVSRRGGGRLLIVAARDDAVIRGERLLVLTRLNGYRASGNGTPVNKYVGEIIAGHSADETSALSLHAKVGREGLGKEFQLDLAAGSMATFRGAGFEVVDGGILQDARPADIDSDGYCILGEHKVEKVV